MIDDNDLSNSENSEYVNEINAVNKELSTGKSIYEIPGALRFIAKPIIVDIDGTVIHLLSMARELGRPPESPIDGASEFLNHLATIGTIVFATASKNWESNKERLIQGGLWDEYRVLLTVESYYPVYETAWYNKDAISRIQNCSHMADLLIEEYYQLNSEQSRVDMDNMAMRKHLAPLFMKPYLIPFVEDANHLNNPGILGFYANEYYLHYGRHPYEPDEFDKLNLNYAEMLYCIKAYYEII